MAYKKTLRPSKGFLVLLLAISLLMVLTGCTGQFGPQGGWSGPMVAGDVVYVGSREGKLLALEKSTGRTRWVFPSAKDATIGAVYGTPALDQDGWLYVGGYNGSIYAINTSTIDSSRGIPTVEADWTYNIGGRLFGGPTVAQGLVLVGSSNGGIYALGAHDGSLAWKFPTGDEVWSVPAVEGDVVYVGSLDHNLYAVGLRDGKERWRFPTRGAIAASPVVRSGTVYIGTFEGIFYAINAVSGKEEGRFQAGNWFWGTPVVRGSRIYVGALDHRLYALDAATLQPAWPGPLETKGPVVGAPTIVQDRIVVPSDDGSLYVVRLDNGGDVRKCAIGKQLTAPLASDGNIAYVAATDRSIRAVEIDGRGNPRELWTRFTNKEEPEKGALPAC